MEKPMAPEGESKKKPAAERGGKHGIVDARVVKALGHPVRVQALTILNERIASPNEISKELGQTVGHVSYHIKVLRECECIELVDTAPRRGAMEHYYRATARAFLDVSDWMAVPASVRPGLSGSLLQTVLEDASAALSAGTFDEREDRHLSWTPMIVDEQGWGDLTKSLEETVERVFGIQAASAERLAKADEAGIPISVALAGYETPTIEEKRAAPKKD
jgi:DNA-binding transcriptional ArsR family regulator